MTVEHLRATMTGIEWREWMTYYKRENQQRELEAAMQNQRGR